MPVKCKILNLLEKETYLIKLYTSNKRIHHQSNTFIFDRVMAEKGKTDNVTFNAFFDTSNRLWVNIKDAFWLLRQGWTRKKDFERIFWALKFNVILPDFDLSSGHDWKRMLPSNWRPKWSIKYASQNTYAIFSFSDLIDLPLTLTLTLYKAYTYMGHSLRSILTKFEFAGAISPISTTDKAKRVEFDPWPDLWPI